MTPTRRDPALIRRCAIHQPHYIPWGRYIHKIAVADIFVLLDEVLFTKNGWQNRNRIKGANGPFVLTVPCRRHSATTLGEVEVVDGRWRRQHLSALRSCYGRSPGFDALYPPLERLLTRSWGRLVDLNQAVLVSLLEILGIQTPCVRSSELKTTGAATERLASICDAVDATHYLSGAFAATAYLDATVLARHEIEILYQHWTPPDYPQAHPSAGFAPDLSVIDLIAACPDNARDLILASGTVSPAADV